MKRNAQVTVIPELRAVDEAGNRVVVRGNAQTFQGEKVMGNNQTISYRLGGRYTMKTNFKYMPELAKSDMYLTFDAKMGKKSVKVPEVKVGKGVIATSELYKKTIANSACIAPDSFERVKTQRQEANIKFLVNQANLRKSELQNNSVQEFVRMLKKINADREGMNIRNVEVKAYASPEGGFSFNDKLANKRQNTSEDYVKNQLKQTKLADAGVDAHYTAQDWDGFQKLVQASNIQDKDVILRVLSMYNDPEQREQQIRNMSEGFRQLATGILPELRRSRLIVNYETIGRSDADIQSLYESKPTELTNDEMLYAATLETSAARQEAIYKKAAEYYDKDYRAYNNLAVLAMAEGDNAAAREYLNKALRIAPDAPEAIANRGLLSLMNGNVQEAEGDIAKVAGSGNVKSAVGTLSLAKGNYAQAEADLEGEETNTAALAQLLNKNYAAAAETLDKVKNPDAMTSYLHAIAAARRGNKYATESYLEEAFKKDPSLKNYADRDLEFSFMNK